MAKSKSAVRRPQSSKRQRELAKIVNIYAAANSAEQAEESKDNG